jgi:hypothetical protein
MMMTGVGNRTVVESPSLNLRLEEMRTCSTRAVDALYSNGACNSCGSAVTSGYSQSIDDAMSGSLSRRPLLPLPSLTVSVEGDDETVTENDVFLTDGPPALIASASSAIQMRRANKLVEGESSGTLCALPPTYSELAGQQSSDRLLSITGDPSSSTMTAARPIQSNGHFQYMHHHHFHHHSNRTNSVAATGCSGAITASATSTATAAALLVSNSPTGASHVALSGSVISVQPHRKCADASTSGPSQAAVRKLTRSRSNLDALNGLVFVLSAVYAKLIVILGLCFPMAEVISHRIPIGWYEGFYLYLYLGECFRFCDRVACTCGSHSHMPSAASRKRLI